ncbi:MAG TPA: hypothetical protein VMA54_05625 [Steroidobacteraceae bacterium]|nr:hypothetical protein [Steroidobacteraceae bacterium]
MPDRVTDTDPTISLLAAFRGAVACSRTAGSLILSGSAADSADDRLIVTLVSPSAPDIPASLTAVILTVAGEHRYRISSGSGDVIVEATSLHVHRDIGKAFYRAVPPRPVPLTKRLFWLLVLWLAGSRTGKQVLASLRR